MKHPIRLILFVDVVTLSQLVTPLFGFVGFVPGFVEAYRLFQRVDGVRLDLATLECFQEQ